MPKPKAANRPRRLPPRKSQPSAPPPAPAILPVPATTLPAGPFTSIRLVDKHTIPSYLSSSSSASSSDASIVVELDYVDMYEPHSKSSDKTTITMILSSGVAYFMSEVLAMQYSHGVCAAEESKFRVALIIGGFQKKNAFDTELPQWQFDGILEDYDGPVSVVCSGSISN